METIKSRKMPEKGQVITMNIDGSDREFRVLSVNGNVAKVLCNYDIITSKFKGTNPMTADNHYFGSNIDNYLEKTWYDGLTDTAKTAINAADITQYSYYCNGGAYGANTHASYADYSTKADYNGTSYQRHAYALDVEDLEEYFGNTFN